MSLRSRAALFAALSLATLAACTNDVAEPGPQPGFVKVVHAIANAGAVNVLADTLPLATNVAYATVGPSANFQYFGLPAGTRQVRVVPVAGSAAVITADVPVESDRYITLVAAGLVGGTGALAPAFIVLRDSVTTDAATAPAAGQIRLRAVHAATSIAGPVDVHAQLVGTGAPRAFSASTRLFANLAFRGSATAQVPAPVTATATVAARNYDICVIAAGVTPTATGGGCAIVTASALPTTTASGLTDAQGRRGRAVVTALVIDATPPATAPRLLVTTDKPVQP
jgi:hypothetical protein